MSSSEATLSVTPPVDPVQWRLIHPAKSGMVAFLCSEVALFTTLIVTYAIYIGGATLDGPTPYSALAWPIVLINSAMLIPSSGTIALALRARRRGAHGTYCAWLALTIVLGAGFVIGTGIEWWGLIVDKGLTIDRNVFGSTFYLLIGFHGCHVTLGVIAMSVLLALEMRRRVPADGLASELISWYWHFVDGVWIVLLILVYWISVAATQGLGTGG